MNTRIRIAAGAIVFAVLVPGASAQKAYRYVDEKGNVTYSQVPPTAPTAKDPAKVDISPAHSSSGGANRPFHAQPGYSDHYSARQDYARARQRAAEEAQQKRVAVLEAECNRSRGSDCKNPETLRYLEQQNVPRPSRR